MSQQMIQTYHYEIKFLNVHWDTDIQTLKEAGNVDNWYNLPYHE